MTANRTPLLSSVLTAPLRRDDHATFLPHTYSERHDNMCYSFPSVKSPNPLPVHLLEQVVERQPQGAFRLEGGVIGGDGGP